MLANAFKVSCMLSEIWGSRSFSSDNIHETLKALANIPVKFHTEHFKSKKQAEKASFHVKALHEIFLEMNDPTASTVHTSPRASPGASSRATLPEPPLAMDLSFEFDDLSYVDVTLDETLPSLS